MQWIGIGFLIAIGFGLAIVALPIALGLLGAAFEFRKQLAIIVGIVFVIIIIGGVLVSDPELRDFVIGWAVIIFFAVAIRQGWKERKQKKESGAIPAKTVTGHSKK